MRGVRLGLCDELQRDALLGCLCLCLVMFVLLCVAVFPLDVMVDFFLSFFVPVLSQGAHAIFQA